MHYEEELDLFCSCIRANISIMLHKTIYEINSKLLFRTHFKPPSSVINYFLFSITCGIWSFTVVKICYAFYIAAQIRISDVHIHLNKITYKPYSIVIVCLLFYIIYSGCCHVYFCCVYFLYTIYVLYIYCIHTLRAVLILFSSPYNICRLFIELMSI